MMKFGLYINKYVTELVDLESGEIVAVGKVSVNNWLCAYDENYTLTLLN